MWSENLKVCNKCGKEKPFYMFHKTSRRYKDKYTLKIKTFIYRHSICKDCRNKERMKKYYEKKGRCNINS